jgi:hypothetical protein
MSKVEGLRRKGFDLSYNRPFQRAWRVRCSQCEAVVVNGTPLHETGCPHAYDAYRRRNDDEQMS